jgi:GT2 family glycosyltransferase
MVIVDAADALNRADFAPSFGLFCAWARNAPGRRHGQVVGKSLIGRWRFMVAADMP